MYFYIKPSTPNFIIILFRIVSRADSSASLHLVLSVVKYLREFFCLEKNYSFSQILAFRCFDKNETQGFVEFAATTNSIWQYL